MLKKAGRDELLIIRRIGTVKKKSLQKVDEQELIPTGYADLCLMVAGTSIRPSTLKASRVGIIIIWKRRTNVGRLLIGVGARGQQESESNHH